MADPDIPFSSNNSFIISIDDTSPTIAYSPFADTFSEPSLATGWNPFFNNTGLADPSAGAQTGSGTSLHVTAANGASLGVRWNGTGIALYGDLLPFGSASNPSGSISYTVSVDGTPTTNYESSFSSSTDPSSNILALFSNLTYGEHLIELAMQNAANTVDGSVLLRFDRADITSNVPPFSSTPASNSRHFARRQSPCASFMSIPLRISRQHGFPPGVMVTSPAPQASCSDASRRRMLETLPTFTTSSLLFPSTILFLSCIHRGPPVADIIRLCAVEEVSKQLGDC